MMILAALIVSGTSRWIGAAGLLVILTHDTFDGARAAWLGDGQEVWKVLHGVAFFRAFPHKFVASLDPIISWAGVMMAGCAAGELMTPEAGRRRGILLTLGGFTTFLFGRCGLCLSLLCLLMTLGPALFALSLGGSGGWHWAIMTLFNDRRKRWCSNAGRL